MQRGLVVTFCIYEIQILKKFSLKNICWLNVWQNFLVPSGGCRSTWPANLYTEKGGHWCFPNPTGCQFLLNERGLVQLLRNVLQRPKPKQKKCRLDRLFQHLFFSVFVSLGLHVLISPCVSHLADRSQFYGLFLLSRSCFCTPDNCLSCLIDPILLCEWSVGLGLVLGLKCLRGVYDCVWLCVCACVCDCVWGCVCVWLM